MSILDYRTLEELLLDYAAHTSPGDVILRDAHGDHHPSQLLQQLSERELHAPIVEIGGDHGEHFIVAEYRSTPIKTPLLVLGAFVLMGTGVARVGPRRLASSPDRVRRLWQTLRVQWSKQRAGRD